MICASKTSLAPAKFRASGIGYFWLPSARKLAAFEHRLEIARAADEHAFHEHHRQRRPAGPHLEREAAAPLAEVAAVLEVLVREPRVVEELARLLRKRVLLHADHHDVVRRDRGLHLFHDVGAIARDLRAHRRIDLVFAQDGSRHEAIIALGPWST